MTVQREVKQAYRPGKRAKKILQPRAARHLGHPHNLMNGMDIHRHPVPDEGKTRTPKDSHITRKHAEMVQRNMELLAQASGMGEALANEQVIFENALAVVPPDVQGQGARKQYAALEAHREIAAQLLACGATLNEAADWAGVTAGTVAKYYADPDIRARVDEYRQMLKGTIGGRILGSLERLTQDPDVLDGMAVRDRLQIYDRFESRPGVGSVQLNQTNVNINSYPELMERLALVARREAASVNVLDAGDESGAFPTVGVDSTPLADDLPSGD